MRRLICAVGSQYAVKNLVDVLSNKGPAAYTLWSAVAVLLGLVAGDNLLWRLAGWVSTYAFVARSMAATFASICSITCRARGTHCSSSVFPGTWLRPHHGRGERRLDHQENSLTWTTIPPRAYLVVGSIIILGTINSGNLHRGAAPSSWGLGVSIGRLAAQGSHLHQSFAGPARLREQAEICPTS